MQQRIIVTGGSGFVGSHTIRALKEKGHNVFNFDLKEGWDIRKMDQLLRVIAKGDKVLHLAAIARFGEADENPYLAFQTNVQGTENVATACEMNGADRLVYSSTGSVYMPIEEEPPILEIHKARGNSVYGCAKFIGEEAIRRKSTPHIVLRYAHLYGEGKIGHGAIGGFIDRMDRGLKPVLYGGKQSNDFTYIKDIVQANILALETEDQENFGEIFNIGTGEEMTTEEVFNILSDIFGYHTDFERLPMRTVDPLRFMFSIDKAKAKLGYDPKFPFKEGMADWHKKNGARN